MLKLELIPNWKQALSLNSVRVALLLALFAITLIAVQLVTGRVVSWAAPATLGLLLLFLVARFVKQPALNGGRAGLIDDWKQALRYSSVAASALLSVFTAVQSELLPLVQPVVPPEWWPWVALGMGASITGLRLVQRAVDVQGA
jgi:hypothetical protein